jgi:dUTP pyrophosphatase
METLKIKKLDPDAKVPERATSGSAGLDLCALLKEPLTLFCGDTAVIPTGLAIEIPSSEYAAFIFARSGLSVKHGIGLLNSVGVIDSDYRGELKVGVINQKRESYTIMPGERIAQLVLAPVIPAQPVEVDSLDETERGEGGFGSTGR